MCWAVVKSKTQVTVTSGTAECLTELKLCLCDHRTQSYKQQSPLFWSETWKCDSHRGLYLLWQWWMDRQPGVSVVLRGRLVWQWGECRWWRPVILSITRCQLPPSPNTHTHQRLQMIIIPKSSLPLPLRSMWPTSYHWANRLTDSVDSDIDNQATLLPK